VDGKNVKSEGPLFRRVSSGIFTTTDSSSLSARIDLLEQPGCTRDHGVPLVALLLSRLSGY